MRQIRRVSSVARISWIIQERSPRGRGDAENCVKDDDEKGEKKGKNGRLEEWPRIRVGMTDREKIRGFSWQSDWWQPLV